MTELIFPQRETFHILDPILFFVKSLVTLLINILAFVDVLKEESLTFKAHEYISCCHIFYDIWHSQSYLKYLTVRTGIAVADPQWVDI